MSDWQFAVFLSQVASAAEAGISTSAPNLCESPQIDPVKNDIPSLRTRVSFLEGEILNLQRELQEQGRVAGRAAADVEFMLDQVNKAAEQLAYEYSSIALLYSDVSA